MRTRMHACMQVYVFALGTWLDYATGCVYIYIYIYQWSDGRRGCLDLAVPLVRLDAWSNNKRQGHEGDIYFSEQYNMYIHIRTISFIAQI